MSNENELRHLFDRRRLVLERRTRLLERAGKRFDTYDAKMRADSGGHTPNPGPRMEFCVVPRFPARPLCEPEQLEPLIRKNNVPSRQQRFPNSQTIISQHESAIILCPTAGFSILEANIWGMLFYGMRIDESGASAAGIHLSRFVGNVLLFIRHAATILKALGYPGPILVETKLFQVLGVPWLYGGDGLTYRHPGSELDDDVSFSVTTTAETLLEKPDSIASDVLRIVFFSVNWRDLVDTQQKMERLVISGYKFNFWDSSNLQL